MGILNRLEQVGNEYSDHSLGEGYMSEKEICIEVRSSLNNITSDLIKRYERRLDGRESFHDESWLATDRETDDYSPRGMRSARNGQTTRKRNGHGRSPTRKEWEMSGTSKRQRIEPTMGNANQKAPEKPIREKSSTVTSATCRPKKRSEPLEEVYVTPSTSRMTPREELVVVVTPDENLEEDALAMNISPSDIPEDLPFSMAPEADESADNGYEELTLDSDNEQDHPEQQ